MKTILANVAAQVAIAEEAAIKRDLNKVVAALLEAVRGLSEGAALLSETTVDTSPPKLAKKPVAKATAKPVAKKTVAKDTESAASKRTAPVIKPK